MSGMHVVQFAFGNDMPRSIHIPHNHLANNIVYSGTHDNNTLQGWMRHELDEKAVKRIENYTDKKVRTRESHFEIIRICYSSVAKIAIIPMQDWLGLDEKARMNKPSTKTGNWVWRMESLEINQDTENLMREFSEIYGRN
jgi:4-alpha-glucanotransferase